MNGETYNYAYLYPDFPLEITIDQSIQLDIAITPTQGAGPPPVEDRQTNSLLPHVLAAYNSNMNREAGYIHQGNSTCFNFALKPFTFDLRHFLPFFTLLLRAFQTSS